MNKVKRDTQFHRELKELLRKFDAELMIEDFGTGWSEDKKMVVDFNWTEEQGTSQLVLGTWENGDA
jgi:hypothetical protein|tara:strand:- start:720 stop:917 length:198 start_codon:yes stop_codon:yes gene_type:complete